MNSSFASLSSYCLLEFRATPLSDLTPPMLSTEYYLVDNKNVDTYQIYNSDGDADLTNNSRNLSTVSVGGSKVIYIDTTLVPIYTHYDPNITETALNPTLSQNLVMDTLRFHFASGFNFTEVENVLVGARYKMNNLKQVQIATVLLDTATAQQIFKYNTRPLFISNTIYDKYIDIKIPAAPWLNKDFDEFGEASFAHAITNGVGFIKNSPTTVFLAEANWEEYNAPNNVTYDRYKLVNYYEGSVSQVNEFDALGCVIEEATDGDYIKFHATWGGSFPDSLIASLNDRGANNNWIFSHQLQVYEQIGADLYPTGNAIIYQEDRFDEILTYRPILKEAGYAVSMSIDYTLRLINTLTGEQVIKTAALSVINPNKYGKTLAKITLPEGPQSMRVYNKVVQKNFELSNLFAPKSTRETVIPIPPIPVVETKTEKITVREYIPIKQMDIMLSQGNALNSIKNEVDQVVYGQGRLVLPIDPVDNFIKFTAYQANPTNSTNQKRLDLNNNSIFKLNFGQTGKFVYENVADNTLASPSRGEFVFRVPKDQALQILGMSDNQFFITLVSKSDGTETLFYTGTWVSSVNYASLLAQRKDAESALTKDKKISELREQVTKVTEEKENLLGTANTNGPAKPTVQPQVPKTINVAAAISVPESQQTMQSEGINKSSMTTPVDKYKKDS